MKHSILFMNAITPVHNGAGEGLGIIDRPIIRERTTNFPFIQASSLKGVLRDEYFIKLNNDPMKKEKVDALFGPEEGEHYSGAVSIGDGNILCFPVRSLKGCFVWATSPLLLYRFTRILEISGKIGHFPKLSNLISNSRVHSDMTDVLINPDSTNFLLVSEKIILEEFPKSIYSLNEVKEFAEEFANIIFTSQSSSFLKDEFIKRFVILPEDTFRYFVTYATEVVPNIKIDDETGTSKEGLRYTEYLPSETILYSLIGFEKARCDNAQALGLDTADGVKKLFDDNKPDRIQIGGDETKGKGFVELSLLK